jgi:hypothetical protein
MSKRLESEKALGASLAGSYFKIRDASCLVKLSALAG